MSRSLQLVFLVGAPLFVTCAVATPDLTCGQDGGSCGGASDASSVPQVHFAAQAYSTQLKPMCYSKDFKGKCFAGPEIGNSSEAAGEDPEVQAREEPNDGMCSSYGRPGSAYCCCGCKTGTGSYSGCCSSPGKVDDRKEWPDEIRCHSA
ncbi:unnamed protein product [Polarella glacialis]|uniref:Uncharacterized protein n=1 Tax=Polarella glacialis TaxID=89957 RepID=A0A813DN34_POLGL|nr:unnamed protein product [Polarella glacialis]